jgi:hypothetical protein
MEKLLAEQRHKLLTEEQQNEFRRVRASWSKAVGVFEPSVGMLRGKSLVHEQKVIHKLQFILGDINTHVLILL